VLASPLLVSALAAAITITPPGPSDEGCPSPRQVTDALTARLPWVVQAPGQPGALRLAVTATPTGNLRVQLSDATGEPVLVRALPPARGKATECPALADTVALIVDRYLHDVGYEAPPLPPPAPPPPAPVVTRAPPRAPAPAPAGAAWQLGAEVEGRYGDTSVFETSVLVSLGREAPLRHQRAGLRLSGGLGPGFSASWMNNEASLRRVPLRLDAYLAIRAGPGRVEPGLGIGADLLWVRVATTSGTPAGAGPHIAPFASGALGYALPLGQRFYARAVARGGAALPYSFLTAKHGGVEVWSTPRTYLEFGVESGVAFP
jgi:hypothetical protein